MKDQIVTITTCPYSRAQLIKSQLEAEGIECFLSNINLIQPGIATGVKVRVNETDFSEAFRIIEDLKSSSGTGKLETIKAMKSIRRILVPVDFSENSINACNFALGLADKLKAEIKLLYSYFNPIVNSEPYLEGQSFIFHMDNVVGDIEQDARKQILQLKSRIQNQIKKEYKNRIKISYSLDRGFPESVIVKFIDKYKPGVVIMGTKGFGGNSNTYLGSVTIKVIEKASVPVLAIPEKSIFSGMKYINRVLYATNFDDSDFKSLRKLMTLVRPFEMKIFCAHISVSDPMHFDKSRMETLKGHFTEEYEGYDINCDLIRREDIVQALDDYVEEKEIDLIALTTHKRGIIERLFNPSIARKMLFHSHLPLLVFHS